MAPPEFNRNQSINALGIGAAKAFENAEQLSEKTLFFGLTVRQTALFDYIRSLGRNALK